MLALLNELRRDGYAIVMATHDLPLAARVCDEVCLLCNRVVACGPPASVLTSSALTATYGSHSVLTFPDGRPDANPGVLVA